MAFDADQLDPGVILGPDGQEPDPNTLPLGYAYKPRGVPSLYVVEYQTGPSGPRTWGRIPGLSPQSIPTDPVYYVDPVNGNDSNAGTITAPLLTINRSLQLLSLGYYGTATINLRAGTHTIGNKTVFPRPAASTSATAGGILINGVDNTQDAIGNRTASGGTTGSQATFGTVVDSAGGLVANAHRGKFLRFTSGATLNGRAFLIEGNSATTFTVEGSIAAAPTTETFVVETPAAIISWPGTQVLQGQGGTAGLQNVILNGPGGANLLQLYNLTLGLQKIQLTNLGSFGITVGEHSSLVNLTALTNQLGTLSVAQQCGSYYNFNATISLLSTSRMSVTRSLFQDVRTDMQQLGLFQALDSTFRGNSWIRVNFGGLLAMDRFHFDTVTPAPSGNAFFGSFGAAIVVSKGSKASILHGDISNTPATNGAGDAVLIEDGSTAQFASVTGTGNAGIGVRLVRAANTVNDQSGTGVSVTGAGGSLKVGQNAVIPWPAGAATNTDPVELCVAVGL